MIEYDRACGRVHQRAAQLLGGDDDFFDATVGILGQRGMKHRHVDRSSAKDRAVTAASVQNRHETSPAANVERPDLAAAGWLFRREFGRY
jgi:hypothetical protein